MSNVYWKPFSTVHNKDSKNRFQKVLYSDENFPIKMYNLGGFRRKVSFEKQLNQQRNKSAFIQTSFSDSIMNQTQ